MSATFDYSAPAELFPSRRYAKSLGRYRRFATAAEGIQYVIEVIPEAALIGTFLNVRGSPFEGRAIRELYDGPRYPLARLKAAA